MTIPSVLGESFNASQTGINELCETFIINSHFDKLCAPNHTIMKGPRGSGKTTLLRMLQVDTLDQWKHQDATKYREKINYSGVFVPTDRLWKVKYDESRALIEKFPTIESLLNSLFIYHVLFRILDVLKYKTDRNVERDSVRFGFSSLSKEDEAELVCELSKSCYLNPSRNTLRSLASSILLKNEEISSFITSVISGEDFGKDVPKHFSGNLIQPIINAIATINLFIKGKKTKWAILFDELELAPESIVNTIINALRGSGTHSLIFKLAISPYHKNLEITKHPSSPMPNQDYTFLNLSEIPIQEGLMFATKLSEQVFNKNGLTKEVSEYFVEPPYRQKTSRDVLNSNFEDLSKKDASFRSYLIKHGIQLGEISKYTDENKGTILRKIQFIAAIRNHYLGTEGTRKSRRSSFEYYAGFEHICRALEFNPRMLIGIMTNFAREASHNKIIPISKQLQELGSFYESFRALLETIAVVDNFSEFNNVYELIEAIGQFFTDEILSPDFNAEPKGSIIFSGSKNNKNYFSAIGSALNAGALVLIESTDHPVQELDDLTQARCRLSYLFAHVFKITMTKQREIDLSKILIKNKKNDSEASEQMDLL